jgi:L-amino acid N-acyltransferase YncA
MSRTVPVTIRDMAPDDWPAVADTYSAGIRSRLATFETSIPEWGQWNAAHLPAPRLIAASAGAIVGCSEDHRFIDPLGAVYVGRETLRHGWGAYFALVSDYRVSVRAMAETAAGVLLVGEAAGRSNGVAWTVPAAWRAVVREGFVAEWQVYADNEPLRASLRRAT